jgi:hypothetical protein
MRLGLLNCRGRLMKLHKLNEIFNDGAIGDSLSLVDLMHHSAQDR